MEPATLSTAATIVGIASPLLTLAAAWGGVKVSLNGTRNRVAKMETQVDRIEASLSDVRVTVGKLEERSREDVPGA